MLKWTFSGCRRDSRSEADFFRNVMPTSCLPAETGMRTFRCLSTFSCDRLVPVAAGVDLLIGRPHRQQSDAVQIDKHLHLMRFTESFDMLVSVPCQSDLDLVFAILRKRVGKQPRRRAFRSADPRPFVPVCDRPGKRMVTPPGDRSVPPMASLAIF